MHDLPRTRMIVDDFLNSTPTEAEVDAAVREIDQAIVALETRLRSDEGSMAL